MERASTLKILSCTDEKVESVIREGDNFFYVKSFFENGIALADILLMAFNANFSDKSDSVSDEAPGWMYNKQEGKKPY